MKRLLILLLVLFFCIVGTAWSADKTISALDAKATPQNADLMVIVDNDSTPTTKKMTWANVMEVKVVAVTSSPYNLTAANANGHLLFVTTAGVQTVNLPDYQAAADVDYAKIGSSVCIYMSTANVLTVDVAADDKIRINGTLGAAGVAVTSDGAAGDYACFVLTDAASDVGHWTMMGYGKTAWQ